MSFLAAPPESNKVGRRSSVAAHGRTTSHVPEGHPTTPNVVTSPIASPVRQSLALEASPSPTAVFDPLTSPSTRARVAASTGIHLPTPPSPAPFEPQYSSPNPFGPPATATQPTAAPAAASSFANPFDIFGPAPGAHQPAAVAAAPAGATPTRPVQPASLANLPASAFDPFATLPSAQPRQPVYNPHQPQAFGSPFGATGAPVAVASPPQPQPVAANPFDIFGDFGKPVAATAATGHPTPAAGVVQPVRPAPAAAPVGRGAAPPPQQDEISDEDEEEGADSGALASMQAAAKSAPVATASGARRTAACMNECGNTAAVECAQCSQALCGSCDEVLHRKASMRTHNRRAIMGLSAASSASRPTNGAAPATTAASASNGSASRATSAAPAKSLASSPETSPVTTTIGQPRRVGNMTEIQVDVLAYMKKGTPFLKYGTYGYPHFRQFQISEDNSKLMWFSSNKKMKDTQIDIDNIDALQLGQTTANFARHKAPELAKSSFSLIYDRRRKTLDLIAKDPNEFKIWTEGLKHLIDRARDHRTDVGEIKQLVVTIPVLRGRRSSMDIVDFKTGQTADTGAAPEALPTRQSGNKQQYREVADGFQKLKHRLQKQKEQLRDSVFVNSTQYENLMNIVRRVDASIQKISEWFQNGEYGACDDEVWRAGVDCESLAQMMSAIRP